MNWSKASTIAEIVSSAAILATLAYLAIQTRYIAEQTQQTAATIISSSRQQSLDASLSLLRLTADYPETVFGAAGNVDEEGVRQTMANYSYFLITEHQWLQYRDGLLDETTWRPYLGNFASLLRSDSELRRSWESWGRALPGFRAAVSEELARLQIR